MHVVSVQVGVLADIPWEGTTIRTGYRKVTVAHRVALRGTSLVGDHQGDESVHGGPRKSVYAYPSEHYPFWTEALSLRSMPWGAFGENLTTAGWLETEARVGDLVRIGSAEFEVTQPRGPCFKMNANFARPDMIERLRRAERSGFYLGAVRDGELGAGDPVELLSRRPGAPSIADLLVQKRGPSNGAAGSPDGPPRAGP